MAKKASEHDQSGGEAAGPTRARRPCPICGRPAAADAHPFCSPRCADVDLYRWLSGSYRIPSLPEEDEDGDGLSSGETTPERDG